MNNSLATFYIVRHGETEWNSLYRMQGHADVPLNDNGRIQAKEAAIQLKGVKFDLAFSSDLLRAKETTEIIALEHALEVRTTKLLRERNLGENEGKFTYDMKEFDALYEKLSVEEKRTVRSSPNSENDEEVITRLITFLRETAITHPGKNILVGTHSGVIRTLLFHVGFVGYEKPYHSININNGAYVILESDGVEFDVKDTHKIKINEL